MARKVYPRKNESHDLVAAEILAKHELATGQAVTLPVPIEHIIELTYELQVVHDVIDEPSGSMILGALVPTTRTIIMNEAHEDLFSEVIGPERFTLGHELAHWVYDADNPDQLALDLTGSNDVFCYDRRSASESDSARIRETNANKLAASLLLPKRLMKEQDITDVVNRIGHYAALWGVSKQTLSIRLDSLGLIDDEDAAQLGF